MLQCVVLGGGLGTRMRPFTDTVPKALIPVLGRPFVDWQLDLLKASGVERVVYSVGYRGEMVRAHVGDGSRRGLEVAWVEDGDRLRGTAGALRHALELGLLEDAFLVLYGDSYLPVDVRAIESAWRASGLPALMTVMPNQGRWDASNAVYEDGRVVLYDKARPEPERGRMEWIDYGLSVLSAGVLAAGVPAGEVADLANLFRDLSRAGRLAGHEVRQRFYEVGSPAGLADLERHLGGALRPPF